MARCNERKRVAAILRRDREEAEAEAMRVMAITQVENGNFSNIQATVLGPTREQIAMAEAAGAPFVPRSTKSLDGTTRSSKAFRRLTNPVIRQIWKRGLISDSEYAACRWYSERYEESGLDGRTGSVDYMREVHSSPLSREPFTEAQQQAQSDIRFLRRGLPGGTLRFFEAIVVNDVPLTRARRMVRVRNGGERPLFKNLAASVEAQKNILTSGTFHDTEINPIVDAPKICIAIPLKPKKSHA